MKILELISNPINNRLSHSKLWANVACAAATVIFVRQGLTDQLTLDEWIAYMAAVGGYAATRRIIAVWDKREEDNTERTKPKNKDIDDA